jgi:hypothetical protein
MWLNNFKFFGAENYFLKKYIHFYAHFVAPWIMAPGAVVPLAPSLLATSLNV